MQEGEAVGRSMREKHEGEQDRKEEAGWRSRREK